MLYTLTVLSPPHEMNRLRWYGELSTAYTGPKCALYANVTGDLKGIDDTTWAEK